MGEGTDDGAESAGVEVADDHGGVGGMRLSGVEVLEGEAAVANCIGVADQTVLFQQRVLARGGQGLGGESRKQRGE